MPVQRFKCGVQGIVVRRSGTVVGVDARYLALRDRSALAAWNSPAQGPGGSLAQRRPQTEVLRLGEVVVHIRVVHNGVGAASKARAEGGIGSAQRGLDKRLHRNIKVTREGGIECAR